MKELQAEDVRPTEKPRLTERLGLNRKPRKSPPASESVRGWAKSAAASRAKR